MFGILRIAFNLLVNISPKIELADERQERVDVRVLPVIFRFHKPKSVNVYPGQLVDVYIGQR